MVKKNNDNVRNLDVDTFSRIHFLIQASYLMKEKLPHLSRFYANTALGISQKLVVRLHPGLKELVCARCGSFTLPGEARYRLRRTLVFSSPGIYTEVFFSPEFFGFLKPPPLFWCFFLLTFQVGATRTKPCHVVVASCREKRM
eukprot:TRINITY_DN1772_c0_g1_i1.p1 TRINITY_DN1772_c0_g1~~TRINITY_DN1772_c0_g1_i1.p1  ORF type:complete len:143 (-),score=17.44 TRINITY_DN1772_c0_g1_i1:253-681(-)